MVIYITIAISLFSFSILNNIFGLELLKKQEKKLYLFFAIFLIIFAGCRYEIGLDYGGYKAIYDFVKKYQHIGMNLREVVALTVSYFGTDPFFVVLNFLMPSFRYLLLIMAILGVGLKCWYINSFTKNKALCYFMYFCEVYLHFDMGIMRQGVAMSFMLFALHHLEENKTKKFIAYACIASLFHITSVVIFPIYFFKKYNIKISSMLALCFIAIIMGYFKILLVAAPAFDAIGLSLVSYRVAIYERFATVAQFPISTLIKFVLIFLLLAYSFYKIRFIFHNSNNVFFISYWYGLFIMLTLLYTPFALRLTKLFYFSQIFALDYLLQMKSKRNLTILIIILILAIVYFKNLMIILPGSVGNGFQKYIPYHGSFLDS